MFLVVARVNAETCSDLEKEIASYTAQLTTAKQKQKGDSQLVNVLTRNLQAALATFNFQCRPLPGPPPRPRTGAHVLTQHNDNMRTGTYHAEIALSPTTVASGRFERLFDLAVDGQVYAQPLYVNGLSIPKVGRRNVVFVATENNFVYAFDADGGGTPIWRAALPGGEPPGAPVSVDAVNGTGFVILYPSLGITSTPVIDLLTNTLYVVAMWNTQYFYGWPNVFAFHTLFALDITTGMVKNSTVISGWVPSSSSESIGGKLYFNATRQINRPGLLLLNGIVYVAFGGNDEIAPYHGWVFGYDADTLKSAGVYCTSPDYEQAGVWQSGNGLSADDSHIFLATGNGGINDKANSYMPGKLGSSAIRLDATGHSLNESDFFTPFNQQCLDTCDLDFGAAGPVLLPGLNQAVAVGKEGRMYLLDTNDLGQFHTPNDNVPQCFMVSQVPGSKGNKQCEDVGPCSTSTWRTENKNFHHVHGSPVILTLSTSKKYLVYVWPEQEQLKAFKYSQNEFVDKSGQPLSCDRPGNSSPIDEGSELAPKNDMPGGILSISENADDFGSAIVWASHDDGDAEWGRGPIPTGILTAYEASNLKKVLWDSRRNPQDGLGPNSFAKFCPPTIANGKVYMATFAGKVAVYGLRAEPLQGEPQRGEPLK